MEKAQVFEKFPRGTFVMSRAGRDAGTRLIVISNEDGAVIVADGKERPLERPKKKNPKHLIKLKSKITEEQLGSLTNKSLRRLLAEDIDEKQECE